MVFEVWAIGGVVALFGSLIGYRAYKKRRAKHGSKREKKLEQKEGLGGIAGIFKRLISRSENEKKEEKKEGKQAKQAANRGKNRGESDAKKDADKAATTGSASIEKEEEVQEATEELEARGIGMVASVKSVLELVFNYTNSIKSKLAAEEREAPALDNLISELGRLENFAAINQQAVGQLSATFSHITSVIKFDVESESGKEQQQRALINGLKESIKESRDVVSDEKEAFRELQSAKKKGRKSFNREIKSISKSIGDIGKEIGRAGKKDANPEVIGQLQREIALMQSLRTLVQQINSRLQAAYKTLDNELNAIKGLINDISNLVKQISKFDKNAEKREKDISKRHDELSKLLQEIEKSFAGLNNGTSNLIHEFAINFSGKLKSFYSKYVSIIEGDLAFDAEIQRILLLNITINIKLEAYTTLSISLEQAEKGIEEGFTAITKLLETVVGSAEQKANLEGLASQIKAASAQIDYETTVEKSIKQYLLGMEQQERMVNARLSELIAEDNNFRARLNNSNQKQSRIIGQAMAAVVNRKVQIDSNYISQARQFSDRLQQRNQIAAQAYNQARRMQARAMPQPR